jgi:glycosyltransferase involved in cell wall biosynthesis
MKKFCRKVLVFGRGKAWTVPNILRTGFSLYPFLVMIYYTPEIKKRLAEEINNGNYDLIHAETFYVMPYLPKYKLPIVLVEQTIMSRVFMHYVEEEKRWWMKPILLVDVLKIKYWEKYFWKYADRLVAVSEEDAVIMKRTVRNIDVRVVPNGLGEDFSNLKPKLHYNQNILYMGNYKWMQNWEAAEVLIKKVFPLIKKQIPGCKLVISGQFPTDNLRKMAGEDVIIDELADADHQGVVDAYQRAGLLVAPIYGPGGTRLKILAAMASMVPVVTTPLGAEGYNARDGESILIGKTPQKLARKAIKILKDRKIYGKIAREAKKLVEAKFTWSSITERLEDIYKEIV